MAIYHSKRFPESKLAHQLLDGLKGLEVGGSAHNAFGLDTINVDAYADTDPQFLAVYRAEQKNHCGHIMPVDLVAPGDKIPVPDKSFDFVISSHVIEHFYDPIGTIQEWMRIAKQYVYMIIPQPNALESDRTKLITGLQELIARHTEDEKPPWTDEHHTRWTCDTFKEMCAAYGWVVSHSQDPDDKVGNGFAIVIDVQASGGGMITPPVLKPAKKGKK